MSALKIVQATGLTAAHRTRFRIAPARVFRPDSLDAAADLLRGNPVGKALAGGLEIVDALKQGERFDMLVDLSGTGDRMPTIDRGNLVIGATTRHADLAGRDVAECAPSIAAAFAAIGNVRVRAQGTVVGNVMARRATYCAAPILLALAARCDADFADGRHAVSIEDIVNHPRETRDPLLIRSICIPGVRDWTLIFDRDYRPMVSVALAARRTAGGFELRVAMGCAHRFPVSAGITVASLDDAWQMALPRLLSALPEPDLGDLEERGYRRRLMTTLLARSLRRLETAHAVH